MTVMGEGKFESRILKKMNERIIKNFMDIIIMAELRNGSLSGYDVISFIHNKFNLLVSSGTVYPSFTPSKETASSKASGMKEKRVYKLTEKGGKTIDTILNTNDKIKGFITTLLRIQSAA